jgi:hypothetical protein
MSGDYAEKRQFFRLRYPAKARPSLRVGESTFPVTELSERGMRIYCDRRWLLGSNIIGVLQLTSAEKLSVTGRVCRSDGNELVICELNGISFCHMMEEQRRLHGQFALID